MKKDCWSVAFAITVDGLQVDFMELPEQYRIQILRRLFEGDTNGTLDHKEPMEYQKAVS